MASPRVANRRVQANSADFRVAAKLLEVKNPFDVVPVRSPSPAARSCFERMGPARAPGPRGR